MRLILALSYAATGVAAEPVVIAIPAPLSTVPICVEASGDWLDVIYDLSLPDVARIEVLSGGPDDLPAWQATPAGLPPGGSLLGEGGATSMIFDPPLRGPMRLASALATGPGLGTGPAGVSFAAYSAGGDQALGPVFSIVTDGTCP